MNASIWHKLEYGELCSFGFLSFTWLFSNTEIQTILIVYFDDVAYMLYITLVLARHPPPNFLELYDGKSAIIQRII